MNVSPTPTGSGSSDPGSAYAGTTTPQRPTGTPVPLQEPTSSSRPAVPPELNLPLMKTSVLASDVVDSVGESSVTPGRGVASAPPTSVQGRVLAPSPMKAQATPVTSAAGYSGANTPLADPATPALQLNAELSTSINTGTPAIPGSAMTRIRTPPKTDTLDVIGVHTLDSPQIEYSHSQDPTPHRSAPRPTQSAPSQQQYTQPVGEFYQDSQFEDDENTEPSSVTGSHDSSSNRERANSIGRIIRTTRKRLSSKDRGQPGRRGVPHTLNSYDSDDDPWGDHGGPIIYGYLHKLGRNGKWQRRFFETDGECLSYYKSSNRTKLLATLDLCKVGGIVMDDTDPTACMFTIQVSDRPYHLRAETSSSCKDWVITLNRIKEARMHIGNVELVSPKFRPPPDLLDRKRTESEEYAAYIVVHPNRPRSRAVEDNIKTWDQLVESGGKPPDFLSNSPVTLTQPGVSSERPPKRIVSHLPPKVMARWQKRQSVVHIMGRRIVRWARRMRQLNCMDSEEDVQLDRGVHPPGHNDPDPKSYLKKSGTGTSKDSSDRSKVSADSGASIGSGSASPSHRATETLSHTEWIGKESQIVVQTIGKEEVEDEDSDSDKETRELS